MALDPKVTGAATVVIIGSGAAAGGVLLTQKSETIGEKLSNDLLPENGFDKEWKELSTTLTSSSESITEDLSEIKTKESAAEETAKGSSLKTWCNSKKSEYSSNQELLALVKKWCVYTIEKKLTELTRNLATTEATGESSWKERAGIFITNNSKSDKEEYLRNFDLSISNKDTEWSKLRDKCKDIYSSGFQGYNTNTWKVADKFCSKKSILETLEGSELSFENEFNSEWDKLVTKAITTSSSGTDNSTKDTTLKTELGKEGITTEQKRSALQSWCKEQFLKIETATTNGSNSTTLTFKDEAKKFCVYTIKEKLDENTSAPSVDSSNTNDSWKKNAKKLIDHISNNTEPQLTDDVKGLKKEGDADGTTTHPGLKTWCESTWAKGYKGAQDLIWKMADLFCRKSAN